MSQMSRSVKPTRRRRARSSSSISQGFDRELDREVEHRALALVEPGGAIVHHHHLAEHRAAELAYRVAVGGDAVEASVLRRHHRRDHLDLQLGEIGRILDELLPIVDERLQLGGVERKRLEHVRNEAEPLVALLEVRLHLRRELPFRELERGYPGVVLGAAVGGDDCHGWRTSRERRLLLGDALGRLLARSGHGWPPGRGTVHPRACRVRLESGEAPAAAAATADRLGLDAIAAMGKTRVLRPGPGIREEEPWQPPIRRAPTRNAPKRR